MREHIADANHTIHSHAERRQFAAHPTHKDVNTLQVKCLAGSPDIRPQIFKGNNRIDPAHQRGDHSELGSAERHMSSLHRQEISPVLDVQTRIVVDVELSFSLHLGRLSQVFTTDQTAAYTRAR